MKKRTTKRTSGGGKECPRCRQIDRTLESLDTPEGRKQLIEMFRALRRHFSLQLKSKPKT